MKVLVLGLGVSGKSLVSFLEKRGDEVVAVDDRWAPKEIREIRAFDLFVPSSGIPRDHPLYLRAVEAGLQIKGEAQIALESAKALTIGVTGTNGKTSVVMLIEHALKRWGKKALAVGNIGAPLASHVLEDHEILVVELSSFQLETMEGPLLDYGLLLNVAEDHLDRYASFGEYAETKAHLEECVRRHFFVHESISKELVSNRAHFFQGGNEEAAWAICQALGMERECFAKAASSFEKPPHRLEFVRSHRDVVYYNDSKATNVAAMVRAIESVTGRIILIAGGRDKALSFAPLAAKSDCLFRLIAFGEARKKIANEVNSKVPVDECLTVEEAVFLARKWAEPGDTVLFSPGCTSFDAFENYAKRGEAFKEYVRNLL